MAERIYGASESAKMTIPVVYQELNKCRELVFRCKIIRDPHHFIYSRKAIVEIKTGEQLYIYIYSTYYMSQSVIWRNISRAG